MFVNTKILTPNVQQTTALSLGRHMSLFSRIFGKKPEGGAEYIDDVLGKIIWIHKDNEWAGSYQNMEFTLSHEKNRLVPSPSMLNYARQLLTNSEYLKRALDQEVDAFLKEVPGMVSIPDQLEEIRSLYYEGLHFSTHKGEFYTFASLGPQNDLRCWRIEFIGNKSVGLGFDS